MIGYLGMSALISGSDLLIKETVKENVEENSKTYVFNERLILTKFYNPGAALGTLGDRPGFLKGLTLFGIGTLIGALAVFSDLKGCRLQKIGLSMMIGGALSNGYERFRYGKVTDYIQFNVKNSKYRRIVYNMGDFSIFVGSFCLILGELFRRDK